MILYMSMTILLHRSFLLIDAMEENLKNVSQQPPSNELIANSFSYLKTNAYTTCYLYNGLNNIKAFFENQNNKSNHQSQIIFYSKINTYVHANTNVHSQKISTLCIITR